MNIKDEDIDELRRFGNLEGSEAGEVWRGLADALESWGRYTSVEFFEALEKEFFDQLQFARNEYEIVKEEEIIKRNVEKLIPKY